MLPTFAARVRNFWTWFSQNAERMYATIEDKRCNDLTPEMITQANLLYEDAAWVFGPGENDEGHSFTYTGEGDSYRQLLAAYWLRRAPNLPGWTFYSARQPSETDSVAKMRLGSMEFNPLEFWITPHVDEQEEEIEITVWHPKFPQMEDRSRWLVTYLWLDEILGELGTQSWIGEIQLEDNRLADAMPLKEFASFVKATVQQQDWKVSIPGETWATYSGVDPESGTLRKDIVAGCTSLFTLIQNIEDGHIDEDPLEGTGAELVYVTLPREVLTPGQEAESRGVYEDALTAVLEPESGEVIGGATGIDHAYIDLLLYDGQASIDLVVKTLRKQGLGEGTTIEYFPRDKAKQRVVL